MQFERNEGTALHISEAYEHEPILPYQPEDACKPCGSCNKVGTQCVDVAAPLTLTPAAAVGSATVTCQEEPRVVCVTSDDGTSCTVIVTQRVCVSVPIRYSVEVEPSAPTIACAETPGSGCCGCCK